MAFGRAEALDSSHALRATILNPGPEWTRRAQASLLAAPAAPRTLRAEEQREERGRALDLLDALTRYPLLASLQCVWHRQTATE